MICPNCGQRMQALFTSEFCPNAAPRQQFCGTLILTFRGTTYRVKRIKKGQPFPESATAGWYLYSGSSKYEDAALSDEELIRNLEEYWTANKVSQPGNVGSSMRGGNTSCDRLAFIPVQPSGAR